QPEPRGGRCDPGLFLARERPRTGERHGAGGGRGDEAPRRPGGSASRGPLGNPAGSRSREDPSPEGRRAGLHSLHSRRQRGKSEAGGIVPRNRVRHASAKTEFLPPSQEPDSSLLSSSQGSLAHPLLNRTSL